jgi:NAD(P)H-hydrate epimerase
VGCPVNASGCFNKKVAKLILQAQEKATALLTGAGMGSEKEVPQLLGELVKNFEKPIILDADALQVDVINCIQKRDKNFGEVIITPHMGEFLRINENKIQSSLKESLLTWNKQYGVTILLKGSVTRICHKGIIYNSTYGGPLLARGGSGDVLGGLIGGLLAQDPQNPVESLCKAAVWQGLAADALAREQGQLAVSSTDILNYLGIALRSLQ